MTFSEPIVVSTGHYAGESGLSTEGWGKVLVRNVSGIYVLSIVGILGKVVVQVMHLVLDLDLTPHIIRVYIHFQLS